MKDPRFKKNDKVKVVYLHFKNFTPEEEVKWDRWFRDKTGKIVHVGQNETMKTNEYKVHFDPPHECESAVSDSFYEWELEFA